MLFVSLAACSAQPQASADPSHAEENNSSASAPTTSESSAVSSAPQSSQEATESSQGMSSQEVEQQVMDSAQKIRFVLSTGEIVVELDDHPGAQALYDLLPLELSFEDYNSTEKIAYLDDELATDGSPDNCDPEVGDLCYYIPWGNLCFFYRDFRQWLLLLHFHFGFSGRHGILVCCHVESHLLDLIKLRKQIQRKPPLTKKTAFGKVYHHPYYRIPKRDISRFPCFQELFRQPKYRPRCLFGKE